MKWRKEKEEDKKFSRQEKKWIGPASAFHKRTWIERACGLRNAIPYETLMIVPTAPRGNVEAAVDFSWWDTKRLIILQRHFPGLEQWGVCVNQCGLIFLDKKGIWDFVEGGDTYAIQRGELQS